MVGPRHARSVGAGGCRPGATPGYDRPIDVYGQEAEVRLLAGFVPLLDDRTVLDVGAELGSFADAVLDAGSEVVHVFEPEPENAAHLRARFGSDRRVSVHDIAVSDRDGELLLHRSIAPDGATLPFGHTVLERPDTDEIAWAETVTVPARSLGSLVQAEEIPSRVGILKIDTEGHDFAVVAGMGELDCDVVMVEHWVDLPSSLGPCPWTADELVSVLGPRGFSHYAFVVHRGESVILQWQDAEVPAGAMGNLVFIHDRVLDRLLPSMLACSSSLAKSAVELAEARSAAAAERLVVIEELKVDRDLHAQVAAERLALLNAANGERTRKRSRARRSAAD